MSEKIVTDEDVERALSWLRDSAREIGEAKRDAILAERMVKHVRALEMKRFSELPVTAQEREALASERYQQAILDEAEAAGRYEMLRALREAAAARIECWRSEQANFRALKV